MDVLPGYEIEDISFSKIVDPANQFNLYREFDAYLRIKMNLIIMYCS